MQAEDGKRDAQESRGLGDVYKRQGIIRNDSDKPLNGLELTVELRDSNGKSLLLEGEKVVESLPGSTMFYTIQPGESTPFDFYTSIETGVPTDYVVTVTNSYVGEILTRPEFSIENAILSEGEDGKYYITGELVNKSSKSVYISTIAGTLLDDDDNLVATSDSYNHSYMLAANGDQNAMDRTPFSLDIDAPTDGSFSQWDIFIESYEQEGFELAPIYIEFTNNYFDEWDDFHIVGTLTNQGDVTYYTSLVAGLYDSDEMVLDAGTSSVSAYLAPGETVPFDISYFSVLGFDDTYRDSLSTFTVQIDPYWTYEVDYQLVDLSVANESVTFDQYGMWTIKGDVTNSTSQNLSSATIMVGLFDTDGNLMATNYAYIYPEKEVFAPGETLSFEAYVWIDPDVDPATYQHDFLVQGVVSE